MASPTSDPPPKYLPKLFQRLIWWWFHCTLSETTSAAETSLLGSHADDALMASFVQDCCLLLVLGHQSKQLQCQHLEIPACKRGSSMLLECRWDTALLVHHDCPTSPVLEHSHHIHLYILRWKEELGRCRQAPPPPHLSPLMLGMRGLQLYLVNPGS